MKKVPKQNWTVLNNLEGILVRQETNRFRGNRWRLAKRGSKKQFLLSEQEFDDYRAGKVHLPWL